MLNKIEKLLGIELYLSWSNLAQRCLTIGVFQLCRLADGACASQADGTWKVHFLFFKCFTLCFNINCFCAVQAAVYFFQFIILRI